jgi:hypothetical protein
MYWAARGGLLRIIIMIIGSKILQAGGARAMSTIYFVLMLNEGNQYKL